MCAISAWANVNWERDSSPYKVDISVLDKTKSRSFILLFLFFSKHYREYLVSLINGHSIDPALLFTMDELTVACRRYHVDITLLDREDEQTHFSRLLKVSWYGLFFSPWPRFLSCYQTAFFFFFYLSCLQKLMDDVPLGDKVLRKKWRHFYYVHLTCADYFNPVRLQLRLMMWAVRTTEC